MVMMVPLKREGEEEEWEEEEEGVNHIELT